MFRQLFRQKMFTAPENTLRCSLTAPRGLLFVSRLHNDVRQPRRGCVYVDDVTAAITCEDKQVYAQKNMYCSVVT